MNKIVIISITFRSIIFTTIVLSLLYVLTLTNVGNWIELVMDKWFL